MTEEYSRKHHTQNNRSVEDRAEDLDSICKALIAVSEAQIIAGFVARISLVHFLDV